MTPKLVSVSPKSKKDTNCDQKMGFRLETLGIDDAGLEKAANVFGVTTKTLRILFNQMKEAGIIVGANDGKYHIIFERISGKLMKERYLKDVFLECINRMSREFENPQAMFAAHTVSISRDMIREFYDEYKTLLEKYMSYNNNGDDLEILQVCTQAIPLLSKSKTH